MHFEIIRAKGQEIPEKNGRVSWPWKDMLKGDKVVISGGLQGRAQAAAHVYARSCGKKFTTRTTQDGLVVERVS